MGKEIEKNMEERKVGVIGGGAAGMMAAITAAREGAAVTILESGERLGRKILSTGNGKCNLGNQCMDAEYFYGAERGFVQNCLKRFGTPESLAFFRGIGLLTKEKNGGLYPLSEQASAVLDALRYETAALGIRVIYGFHADRIKVLKKAGDTEFAVEGSGKRELFDRLIISCGGKAAPVTGSDGSGYELAKQLGHRIVPVVPALTFLKCRENFFKGISGVRAEAEISLLNADGGELATERGELQLTDSGISGIPVFQVCRTAAYILREQKEIPVRIDFLPGLSGDDLSAMATSRKEDLQKRTAEEFFTGILNKKLMTLFLKMAGVRGNQPAAQIPERELCRVLQLCKDFCVTVVGTGTFQNAQVCAGGVDTAQITENMESKLAGGVYFAGEVMDVDGRCGGYNLQWAWTSGYLAGRAAASKK